MKVHIKNKLQGLKNSREPISISLNQITATTRNTEMTARYGGGDVNTTMTGLNMTESASFPLENTGKGKKGRSDPKKARRDSKFVKSEFGQYVLRDKKVELKI